MERKSPSRVVEQFIKDSHLTMQRDSWSEDIDLLRNSNEDRWSQNGDHFQRDSPYTLEGESHVMNRDGLERDSLSEEENERDGESILANGDSTGFEKNMELVTRHLPVKSAHQDYAFHYEGDSLSLAYPLRSGYERVQEPAKGYDRLSVDRAHTMKDFEKQITELKKENFNLKLRIYFLEEQVQRHCDNSSEELHRMNIELKVEVESLKHEYQEKQNLLIRASKAMESLAGEHNLSIQQLKDDHVKQLQELEKANHRKTQLLEDQLKQEKAELEKICVLLDQERMQRFNAEERLLAVKEQYNKSMTILEERDWIIQCLNETLCSKDALITQLEKQINTMMPGDTSTSAKTVTLLPENDLKEGRSQSPGLTCRDCLATKSSEEKEENVNEWQKKVKEMGNVIKELQKKLEDGKAGIAVEEKNSMKRDKAIQGLTIALKKKTKENEKLLKEIDNLNSALAQARASGLHQQGQNLKNNSDPDYKKLVLTIQAQQDLCSRLHEYERESGSLQKEFDAIVMLRKWLEKDIQSNQELRKVLEAQIMSKYRESDTMSFLGDQTSYMSLCLDPLSDHNHHGDGNLEAVLRPEVKSVEMQTSVTEGLVNSLRGGNLERSVIEKDIKEENAAAVVLHAKRDLTERSQNTASSSTQTESRLYVNKGILVDMFAFEKETKDPTKNRAEEILGDSEHLHSTADLSEGSCDIQNNKQQKCFSNNQTKSRIPVLLTSSLGKRLKTEACLASRENEHNSLHEELQEETRRLLNELKCVKIEIEALKSSKEKPQVRDDTDNTGNESSSHALEVDLQPERLRRLSEEVKGVKLEIEVLKSSQEKPKSMPQGRDDLDNTGNESSKQVLEVDLQPERLSRFSEQLKCTQVTVEKLQPAEDFGKGTEFLLDLKHPKKDGRDSVQKALLEELGNDNVSEEIKPVRLAIKEQPSREAVSENTKSVLDVNIAEKDASMQSLHEELQLENLRLTEQLKCAQMDIEKLQAREASLQNKKALSDLDSEYTFERDMAVSSLIKELQLENQRLVEQLKCAREEIEKLQEEKASQDMDSSFRLDNLDTDDRDSEHSFLDKTVTNAVSLSEIHNVHPDFEVQVNSHNFTCQNIAGLCCHHNSFCIECANNQETLIVQSSSFKKVSTIQKECKLLTVSHSQRPFEDTSLSKYDLLVQSQARELSHQRQKIKESHNLSVVCSKNFINVLKAFEDLLSTSSLDSNIALGFQEQLAQTVEWLKELQYKLSDAYDGEDDANSDHSADSLLYTPSRLVPGHKMWADKHGCHVLGLVEDYNALRKQILEAKTVLEETEAFIDHGVQTAVLNMTEHFGNVFFEKLNRTKQSLEEANSMLKLLWRVSLPLQTHSSYSIRQAEEANLEMTRLRKRVMEQEKLLSGMVKKVYSENQMKEDIEKLILNQLAMTHEILKRAKGNLAVQVVDKH